VRERKKGKKVSARRKGQVKGGGSKATSQKASSSISEDTSAERGGKRATKTEEKTIKGVFQNLRDGLLLSGIRGALERERRGATRERGTEFKKGYFFFSNGVLLFMIERT